MNWGKGLTIAMVLFIGYILSMVFMMLNSSSDKVEEDYYQQEIKYEQRKVATENGFKYSDQISVTNGKNQVEIIFPEGIDINNVEGTIHFYRPENASLDRKYAFNSQTGRAQLIPNSELAEGNYVVKLLWKENDTDFYVEKKVKI